LNFHLFTLRAVCRIDCEISGREHLPDAPYLIAARHQSMWETIVFHKVLDNPAMLAKDTLFAIPLIGALMRKNGHIPIDRSGSIDAFRRALGQAADAVKSGRTVLIFPQGTRAKQNNNDLKLGVLVLYRKLACTCVPVVLNSGKFWPASGWILRPGTIKVRILPAIKPGLTSKEFLVQIKHDLETTV
jgi:1-acyl-sn-glycerol-3-phosphate acyltransferase